MIKYFPVCLIFLAACSQKNTTGGKIDFQGGEFKVYHDSKILIDINQYTNGSRIKINLADGSEVSLVLDEKLHSLNEIFIVKSTQKDKKFISIDAVGEVEFHNVTPESQGDSQNTPTQ